MQALVKQLANKQESKRALIYLENKINSVVMMLEGDGKQADGEGCFTKKPISCASCDKDLEKFKGTLGDYKGWVRPSPLILPRQSSRPRKPVPTASER